jgi:hypothetical protein
MGTKDFNKDRFLNKSKKFLNIVEQEDLNEMGRPRKEMVKLLDALDDTLQEHLWKVFAYHDSRPKSMSVWLRSLNKHLKRLRIYNIQERGSGFNFKKETLYNRYTNRFFGQSADIEVLIGNWSDEGSPTVPVSENDQQKLIQLSNKYIDLIFQKSGKFSVTEDELL